jgi:hypothetical protein
MASTYLTSNIGSPSQQRFTWSLWVKRSKLGVEQHMVGNYNANNRTHLFFTNTEKLYFYSELSGSNVIAYQTNRLFRDLNAWYHIVCAVDTTQAGGNRIRIYVNGEEETSFATETECNQNTNLSIGTTHYIGTYGGDAGSASYSFDGSMSHLHFVDGSQLTPSSFGSTDSTTGEWKINTAPSVTYGSSGYFILKDGNSVTDQSGNSNNFTVAGGTLTKTEDNPSNVFAVVNSLSTGSGAEFAYGNTRVRKDTSGFLSSLGTIACGLGKYYWEVFRHGGGDLNVGICLAEKDGTTQSAVDAGRVIYTGDGYIIETGIGGGQSNLGITFGDTDIIGIALDTENGILNFYKNGTLVKTITSTALLHSNNEFVPAWQLANGGEARNNFGNGYFGTTAVSSAGTNASNNGIFEYDVPTGYTALSTKGLNL